jgi:hypothetical protein
VRAWTDKNPNVPTLRTALIFSLAVAIVCLLLVWFGGGRVGATVNPDANQVSYWCPNGGVKYDPVDTPFVVPPGTWTLLVLKAGSEESTDVVNQQFTNPTVGSSYVRDDGKDISHAILCYGVPPTTTTAGSTTTHVTYPSTTLATTTSPSTTLATTTTGATTTVCAECTIDTQAITTTTAATTTTTATTLPQTTTTAGSCAPLCAGQFGTTTTTAPTTTTVAPTTTAAPTTTVAPTTIPDTTAADQTVPGPAASMSTPTQLPVTGGNFWWLILFGSCMTALGLLIVAWTRPTA